MDIQQVLCDPFSAFPYKAGAYLLANNTTDSAVWHTSDGSSAAGWGKGAEVSGTYGVIRATKNAGGVLIANADASGTTWTHTFTGATDLNTWTPVGGATSGVFSGGQWNDGTAELDGVGNWHRYVNISKTFSATITSVSFKYNMTKGFFFTNEDSVLIANQLIILQGLDSSLMVSGSGQTFSWSGSSTVSLIEVRAESSLATSAGALTGSCAITEITISGIGTDPFGGGGGTGPVVRYSSDYGATFGAELPAGSTSPGAIIGFDVQAAGGNSFISGDGAVYRATTIGGAYSSWYTITGGAQAIVIVVPYRTWSGLRNTSNTHPDIVVGFNTPDGSSRTLIWIEGGASPGIVHDITPAANLVFDSPFSVTISFNHHLLVFGKIAGSPKIYRSTNRASSWSLVASTAATFIRCRRQDLTASASGSNKGQVLIAGASGVLGFTKTWAASGFKPRTAPAIVTLDTVF